MTSVRRAAGAAAALAAVLAASACSGGPAIHPGAAADVDGERIELTQVDFLAEQLCALEEPGLAQEGAVVPMALLRSVAVEVLVTDALLPAFASEAGVDLPAVRRAVRDEAETAAAEAPKALRTAYQERLELDGARRAVLETVGQAAGATSPAQAAAAGSQIFAAWRAEQDVSVDPRFGAFDLDQLAWDGQGGSLSVPTDAAAATFDLDAAADLPAEQRCGSPA